jgi:hypothetical protein
MYREPSGRRPPSALFHPSLIGRQREREGDDTEFLHGQRTV